MKIFFRWLLRIMGSLVLVVVLVFAVVTIQKIPINLTKYKKPVEALVSKALDRPVIIENSIVVSTSLTPEFSLGGLRIGNPDGYSEKTFMYLESAGIQVKLLPLLRKKIHIPEISVQKVHVNLIEKEGGEVNWIFASTAGEVQEKTTSDKMIPQKDEIAGDSIVLEKLVLENIAVKHYSPGIPEPSDYQIDKCIGSMHAGKPMGLDITGSFLSLPYTLGISIASLEEFLTENRSWMDIKAGISGVNLQFSGNINLVEAHRSLALKAIFSGENLSSLSGLLQIDLPPLATYSIETDLFVKKDQFVMKNLTVKTGSSSLTGTAEVTQDGDNIEAVIEFTSPLIQLNDFVFDDWSLSGGVTEEAAAEGSTGEGGGAKETAIAKKVTEVAGVSESPVVANRKLLDPELLDKLDVMFTIHAEQVLSGEDKLGSGLLKTTLRDGRVAIEPLELKIPGGSIEMSASVKPGPKKSDAALKVVMSNFDIGIWVRRSQPESQMGGLVNVDIDLQSSAASLKGLLENGNGYFDFSGNLENLGAGIIDLWAVNLVAAIVSSTDENQSTINCAVGRWSVKDGLLTPDMFFIDTSKIRICGKGKVDFKKERVDLAIAPSAKKPEFFNLATPLEVHGTFDDINFGVKQGAVVGTAFKFITSPVHVPLRRIFTKGVPKDGSDACTVLLGPDNRSELAVAGCR